MKNFYSKFRIALMTLAIGLASVWFFKGMNEGFFDVPVELPKVISEEVLVIFSRKRSEIPAGGSGSGKIIGHSEKPLKPKSVK